MLLLHSPVIAVELNHIIYYNTRFDQAMYGVEGIETALLVLVYIGRLRFS